MKKKSKKLEEKRKLESGKNKKQLCQSWNQIKGRQSIKQFFLNPKDECQKHKIFKDVQEISQQLQRQKSENILTFLSFYIKYKKILIDYLIENILECKYWLVLFLISKLWFYIFQLPQYQKETWYNLLSANEPELYVLLELLYEQTFSENFCWCRWFCCFFN